MSLARKDHRFYLDHDVGAALKILVKVSGLTEAQYLEDIVAPIVVQRLHDANLIAAETTVAGISRITPEKHGEARNHAEKRRGDRR